MNLKIAVVGAPQAGKTLFCINFAEFLGAKSLCYTEEGPLGRGKGVVAPSQARRLMVHPGTRSNGVMRSFSVNLLGNSRRIVLFDTVSLKEKNPLPRSERKKLLTTLQALMEADAVLHLVDLTTTDPAVLHFIMEAGQHLANYCLSRSKIYVPLGSKCDLLPVKGGLAGDLTFPGGKLMPVSSLTRHGFLQLREQFAAAGSHRKARTLNI